MSITLPLLSVNDNSLMQKYLGLTYSLFDTSYTQTCH